MALLGTLADFHVDDILVLLASTRKTGVLVVEGGGRCGRVWVDVGHVVGGQSGSDHEPAAVVFDLLRLDQGRFSFDDGVAPPTLGPPLEVPAVLAEARAKLAEWREIEAVVPTMSSLVALDANGGGAGDITIGADEWRTVAAVGAGGTVAEVAARLSTGEFAACKAVKALVDAGLATVAARPLETPATAPPAASEARPGIGAPAPGEPVPAVGAKPADGQSVSRSELVRQLSQLRGG
ncbi:MAG: DUF4388 domain-containing protein [Actinomycetota bacterium]|nr:DUF4388 domain-containing protein [Actinomycetota bacterium]PLS74782.1 MAG: hypothetical protein CYG61_10720 [Actinomycetota bacterium]